jgi:hypothetical protein
MAKKSLFCINSRSRLDTEMSLISSVTGSQMPTDCAATHWGSKKRKMRKNFKMIPFMKQ